MVACSNHCRSLQWSSMVIVIADRMRGFKELWSSVRLSAAVFLNQGLVKMIQDMYLFKRSATR